MIVDSSALVAIILLEPAAPACLAKLESAASVSMSAVSLTETSMVLLSRAGRTKVEALHAFLMRLDVEIVPMDQAQAELAFHAFDLYGKGRQNKAQLNLGDCFVYALAKHYGEPLLLIGNDFVYTDLLLA